MRTGRTTIQKENKGFTLVEVLVAFALFTIVMTIVAASITAMATGNRKERALREAMDGINAAMESMSRNIGVGVSYDCELIPSSGATSDCANGGSRMGFISSSGQFTVYQLANGEIERCISTAPSGPCAGSYVAMTPPEVTVNSLKFYVQGSSRGDDEQPHVTITISGKTSTSTQYVTPFFLETTVTERLPDI